MGVVERGDDFAVDDDEIIDNQVRHEHADRFVLSKGHAAPILYAAWANAGLYMAAPSLFDPIPARPGLCDFGFDVLPRLMGRMYAFPLEGFYCDIGTPERLEYARRMWRK